jgi:hypothetical protein
MVGQLQIAANKGPNGATNVHDFFGTKRPTINTNKQKTATTAIQPPLDYATRVPLPDATGLTRSQRLFTISTGIHVDSLKIGANDEFFIFMRLRSQHKWASFKMNPSKWVQATKLYNAELQSLDQQHGRTTIPKNPRALMTMLGTVEATVSDRILTGNYKCESFSSFSFLLQHLMYSHPQPRKAPTHFGRSTVTRYNC